MLHDPSANVNLSETGHAVEGRLDALSRHLADLQRQVEQLQRLASLGTMSAMLAHEFNNVLTPILGYAQYACERGETDLMRTALDKTLKNGRRLAAICTRVLGMAAPEQMGPRDVALGSLVADAVECLGRGLEKDNIELIIDVPPDLKARAHAASLQQVLFNLLLNARQAMLDRPGRLTITARPAEEGRVSLQVADTGPGIQPEHAGRIFEPFFSTKRHESRPDRGGIGLGLSVCKRLMIEQEGDITVASVPGRGATFTLTLPAVDR